MKRNNKEEQRQHSWFTASTVGAGLAAVAGGLYWLATRFSEPKRQDQDSKQSDDTESSSSDSYLGTLTNRANIIRGIQYESARGFPDESISATPYINNLDTLLHEIYLRYVAIEQNDFRLHYRVFETIFLKMHQTMKEVDEYYRQFSSTVQYAGSHYDRLRIKKPDEFDIDVVIGLPLNMKTDRSDPSKSDIVLEPMSDGFVKLKMGTQFQKNKTLYSWRDSDFYLLRSKFSDWFKSLVYRALNKFEKFGNYYLCYVDDKAYVIGNSEAGPAVTLKIRCVSDSFKMDVDLVPVLKFPEGRWPVGDGYREIPQEYRHENFMVVPKPNKSNLASRSWRTSLIYQERKMLDKTYNLRQTVRFLKKLRDTFEMKYFASYYVKTLFFWVVWSQDDPLFWRQSPAKLFTVMAKKLHAALTCERVPYFWNDQYNLIQGAAWNVVAGDVNKLAKLIRVLDDPSEYKKVAEFLLTPEEYKDFSRFLQ